MMLLSEGDPPQRLPGDVTASAYRAGDDAWLMSLPHRPHRTAQRVTSKAVLNFKTGGEEKLLDASPKAHTVFCRSTHARHALTFDLSVFDELTSRRDGESLIIIINFPK